MTNKSGRYFLRLRCAPLAIAVLLVALALLPKADTVKRTTADQVPNVVDVNDATSTPG